MLVTAAAEEPASEQALLAHERRGSTGLGLPLQRRVSSAPGVDEEAGDGSAGAGTGVEPASGRIVGLGVSAPGLQPPQQQAPQQQPQQQETGPGWSTWGMVTGLWGFVARLGGGAPGAGRR
jgi:hypothetical protein